MPSKWIDKTISVVGLGYIGLPSAAVFASRGVNVVGVDINQRAVDVINAGGIHIVEPDLDIIVRATVTEKRLRAVTTPEPADAFLLAVPTPFKNDHEPDLSFIESACKAIAKVLKKNDLVILESTSPVGATEKVSEWLAAARPDLTFPHHFGEASDIRVAHCPERVLPGNVLRELVANDRIIGGITAKCSAAAVDLYKVFVEGECLITNARTAEMCKLTENASRDVAIAFANELSIICDNLEIDPWELIRLANRHPRVNILQPGPGVGGHCIAVDPWFIVHSSPNDSPLIRTARNVNDSKPHWVEDKVLQAISAVENRKGKQTALVACLGLAFKANIDDLRESPALEITKRLATQLEGRVVAVEPNIKELPEVLKTLGVALLSQEEALAKADVIVVLVDHREFTAYEPVLRDDVTIIDTKGIWPTAKDKTRP